jgi:uncharacterized protein (DUF433 family)
VTAMAKTLSSNSILLTCSSDRSANEILGSFVKEVRVTVNPNQMGGVPCIRGMRIPVATVLGLVAEGLTAAEVLRELPYLNAEDIEAALHYAYRSLTNAPGTSNSLNPKI